MRAVAAQLYKLAEIVGRHLIEQLLPLRRIIVFAERKHKLGIDLYAFARF